MASIDDISPNDDESDSLGEFAVPSAHFAINYYHGLPSKPPLLATTKPQPPISPIEFFPYPVSKTIHVVSGRHPIASMWDSGISDAILDVLTESEINWTSLEVVHIPEAKDQFLGPAIVCVGVEPGTLNYNKAARTARKCQEILNTNGVADCFVEMRSLVATKSGGCGVRFIDLFTARDKLREEKDPFTATLGFPICAKETPNEVGSGGFFLTLGDDDKNIYLVTARHVVLVESFEESKVEYIRTNKGQPKREIVRIGSNARLQSIVDRMASRIGILDEGISRIKNAIEDGTATPDDREDLPPMLRKVARLNDLHKHISSQWAMWRLGFSGSSFGLHQ
ncbi:hypothetical protein TWF506_003481 [Arthrobotrys conoides]|uniref:Uncharacterized protein n=1 Tax=Arthrobotrys conoides TaxID=74498 RepID=A0AAN8RQC6_9PEZI